MARKIRIINDLLAPAIVMVNIIVGYSSANPFSNRIFQGVL
ncbi:hypothetical protein [Enterococcus sp. DIV0660C]|nr:hypothetical protein [Enterococcus sp. DIV0660C]